MTKTTKTTKTTVKPQMTRIDAKNVAIQPRTLMLPRPAYFFVEPWSPKRELDKGNENNQIIRGTHQVDPNRIVSCAPVMPNILLLRETGNPYPANESDETVTSNEYWAPFVRISHYVWNQLDASPTQSFTAASLIAGAFKATNVGANKKGEPSASVGQCVLDTLRDLRLYGLVDSKDGAVSMKKTAFQRIDDPMSVKLLKELEAEEFGEEVIAA